MKKLGKGKILPIILAALMVVMTVCLTACGGGNTKTPDGAVVGAFEALKKGDKDSLPRYYDGTYTGMSFQDVATYILETDEEEISENGRTAINALINKMSDFDLTVAKVKYNDDNTEAEVSIEIKYYDYKSAMKEAILNSWGTMKSLDDFANMDSEVVQENLYKALNDSLKGLKNKVNTYEADLDVYLQQDGGWLIDNRDLPDVFEGYLDEVIDNLLEGGNEAMEEIWNNWNNIDE